MAQSNAPRTIIFTWLHSTKTAQREMAYPPTSPSVQAFALSVVVLHLKFFICTRFQAPAKYDAGTRPPEDTSLGPLLRRPHIKQDYGVDTDAKDTQKMCARQYERRWNRIIMNDLENIPFALFTFGAAVLLECDESRLVSCIGVFTAARCVYSYCFAKSLQPHRTLACTVGALAVAVTTCDIVMKVLTIRS